MQAEREQSKQAAATSPKPAAIVNHASNRPVLQIFGRPLVLVSVSLTPWISPRKHSTTMPPILVPADR
jgi:hypothetical protein